MPYGTIGSFHAGKPAAAVAEFDDATLAWVAAVVTNGGTVSGAREIIVDNLIVGLKADGIFSKLDRLWLFASENEPSALTDIIATVLATKNSTPVFAVDLGYDNGGGATWISTGFNATTAPSPKFTQDSACFFGWSNTSGNISLAFIGGYRAVAGTFIEPDDGGNSGSRCNSGTTLVNADANGNGFYAVNRSTSAASQTYRNGTAGTTDTVASIAPANAVFIFANGFAGNGTRQISCGGFGQSLTGTEHTNLYNRMRTYMTAVGVP